MLASLGIFIRMECKWSARVSRARNRSDVEALADGLHVLVAFPSRANHESVKTKDALSIIPFWIGKKGDAAKDFTKKPMLIYSRPKGDYKGETANHVLIDFYVANVTLAPTTRPGAAA